MDTLKVIEETQIAPPTGSVPPTILPCTYFDIMHIRRSPVRYLIFYASPQPKTILPNLKHSLSLALQRYFPLAGNLKWPQESIKPELVYNNGDSVALTVAESDSDFSKLSDTHAQELGLFLPLYARFREPTTSSSIPLLALQITFFHEKGISIGITFSHVAVDGNTILSFIKTWASLHRYGTSAVYDSSSLVFYDRSTILEGLHKNEALFLNRLKEYNISKDAFGPKYVVPKGVVQATCTISHNWIKILKHRVSTSASPSSLHLSSFSVTCAYAWVCFLKARWSQRSLSSLEATQYLLLPVDARAHLHSPMPSTYFGNCIVGLEVKGKTGELLGEQGVVIAAKLIGKAIQNINVYAELDKYTSYYHSLPPEHILLIASYPKHGVHAATDFGWGKPKRFKMTSLTLKDLQSMALNDSPDDEGGVEISFGCKTGELEAFASAFAY